MKKRIIALALATIMTLSMVACGKEEVTNTSNETNTTSESTTDVVETEPTNVVEETTEPTDTVETVTPETEPVEEVFVFDLEYGMAKVNKMLEAHTILLSQGKLLEDHVQYDTESLTGKTANYTQFTTADGLPYQDFYEIAGTAIIYYNNYVNNNGEYYDFAEWLSNQENDMSIKNRIPGFENDEFETNNILLLEAIGLIAYMKSCETVEATNFIETTDYTVSGIQSAYLMTIACNGLDELEAVFDAEGHLLNIWAIEDGWNKYMTSFPDGDMGADAE